MGFPYGFNVSPIVKSGRLSLWWDTNFEVEIYLFSKNIIDARVRSLEESRWRRITGVYGTAYRAEKADFWRWMGTHVSFSAIPWLCDGDFNEYMWDSEKSGGSAVLYAQPQYLADFMSSAELIDLDFNGPAFTWRGSRNGELVDERLDKGLANQLWQLVWPNTRATHGTVLDSDHCPIIIHCDPRQNGGRYLFRFQAFWAKEEDCRQVVTNCWNRHCDGDVLARWHKGLYDCRYWLMWSRNTFNRRTQVITELMSQLDE